MRMISDDAMEVHFSLRLCEKVAADHACCHNWPGVNGARNCGSCSVGQAVRAALSGTSVKWMKLSWVVPAFPLAP